MKPEDVSVLNLAFLGDAVYSVLVREYLVNRQDDPVAVLTSKTKKFVTAKAQAAFVHELTEEGFFTEEELSAHGVNIVIYANQLTRSAFPAMQQTAEDILKYHRAKEVDDRLMSIKNIITLIDEI